MTPEMWGVAIPALINVGAAVAVIVVVFLFLGFLERRETAAAKREEITAALSAERDKLYLGTLDRMSTTIDGLRDDSHAHDAFVRERLSAMTSVTQKGGMR